MKKEDMTILNLKEKVKNIKYKFDEYLDSTGVWDEDEFEYNINEYTIKILDYRSICYEYYLVEYEDGEHVLVRDKK